MISWKISVWIFFLTCDFRLRDRLNMGWKRKSSSPELQPNPAKAPKRESISISPFSLKLSPSSLRRKVSTPTKTRSIQTPVQLNCQEQNSSPGNAEIGSIPWGKLIAELDICFVFSVCGQTMVRMMLTVSMTPLQFHPPCSRRWMQSWIWSSLLVSQHIWPCY